MYNTLIIVSRFINKASAALTMESEVRALTPQSLRYWKKVYNCYEWSYVTITVKAFLPF